jgi:hypothetical protein
MLSTPVAGNAWTDAYEDNKGAVEFWYYHALISDTTRLGLLETCNFSSIGPLKATIESSVGAKVLTLQYRLLSSSLYRPLTLDMLVGPLPWLSHSDTEQPEAVE